MVETLFRRSAGPAARHASRLPEDVRDRSRCRRAIDQDDLICSHRGFLDRRWVELLGEAGAGWGFGR